MQKLTNEQMITALKNNPFQLFFHVLIILKCNSYLYQLKFSPKIDTVDKSELFKCSIAYILDN